MTEKLVLAGAFDTLMDFNDVIDRNTLLKGVGVESNYTRIALLAQQRALIGASDLNFRKMLSKYELESNVYPYAAGSEIMQDLGTARKRFSYGGVIIRIGKRSSVHGDFATLTVQGDDTTCAIVLWSEFYSTLKDNLTTNKIILGQFLLRFDNFLGVNRFELTKESKVEVL